MEPILGQIMAVAFNFVPKGWLPCDGRLLPIAQYNALFSLLNTTYGGDGYTTFALPNLNGRTVVGTGALPGGSYYELGQMAGTETVMLTNAEMPAHSHVASFGASEEPPATTNGNNNILAASNIFVSGTPEVTLSSRSITVGSSGSNAAHPNMQPYIALIYCIATEGLYPSRP